MFADEIAHTALFLKAMSGIPFSVTAHGQDFMADLGNDDLLREICDEAEFVAVETEYSRGLMQARCPNAATNSLPTWECTRNNSTPAGSIAQARSMRPSCQR